MEEVRNPHDKLFRDIWSSKHVACDFLNHYLPGEIIRHVNLEAIEAVKDTFIEKELKDYYSDLLYKTRVGGIHLLAFRTQKLPGQIEPIAKPRIYDENLASSAKTRNRQ